MFFPVDIQNLNHVPAFRTKDGSEIRELLAHRNSAIRNQSLAEARIPVGGSTLEHFHPRAEEIYFITAGSGKMRIENETHEVKIGDAIAIPPGKKRRKRSRVPEGCHEPYELQHHDEWARRCFCHA